MAQTYSVIFSGKVAEGFEVDQVKQNMAQVFKLSAEKVDKLFSGKPVAIKRSVDQSSALKFRNVMAKAGALGVIREDGASSSKQQTGSQETVKAAPAELTCPRCGHHQTFTESCGLCKMDLTLHIMRIERKARVRALRNQATA